jgi:hypothetical protein
MDIVTALSVIKRLGIVTNWAEASIRIRLLQNGSHGILGGVHFEGVGMIRVGLLEDRVTQNDLFKPLDGGSAARGPYERRILLREFGQRFGNVGKTSNERSLVAENSECAADLLHSGQLFWPGS